MLVTKEELNNLTSKEKLEANSIFLKLWEWKYEVVKSRKFKKGAIVVLKKRYEPTFYPYFDWDYDGAIY